MPHTDFQVQAIRHATMILTLGDKRILVDPMLSDKDANAAHKMTRNSHRNWPLVDLPVPVESLFDVDAILVTHLHFDHFDSVAEEVLPRDKPVFCQPTDAEKLRELGFQRVLPIEDMEEWAGITIHRVDGNHGRGMAKLPMGKSSGYVLTGVDGKAVYIGGDAVFDDLFRKNLDRFKPQHIILFGGEARLIFGSPITMGSDDILGVCNYMPDADVVVVHMETMNHCDLTRAELRRALDNAGVAERVSVPEDGESVQL